MKELGLGLTGPWWDLMGRDREKVLQGQGKTPAKLCKGSASRHVTEQVEMGLKINRPRMEEDFAEQSKEGGFDSRYLRELLQA